MKNKKNKKHKKHIEYIDMARGFGICAIVYSHFTNIVSVLKPDLSTSLGIRCLSLFHIPLFFIVRGQVLAYRGEMELNKKFLSKRVRDLIVPYIFFCMLYTTYVYVDMTIHHIPNAMVEVQRNLLHTFTFYGVSVLWFLPMMFLGELWYVILKNKVNKTIVSVMICTLMLVTYIVSPYLEVTSKRCFWMQSMGLLILNYILVVFFRSFLALFYIWLGYQSVSIFQKLNGKVKKEIIGVAILLGVGIIFLPYTQTIEIHYLKLGKRIYSFISTICFSFGFLLLFQIMENKPIKWLAFLGTNSLWIMCTHKDFGIPNWCIQVGDFFVSISPRAKNYVFWITAFGTLLLVEIGLSIFFNKIAIWNKQMHCSGRGG